MGNTSDGLTHWDALCHLNDRPKWRSQSGVRSGWVTPLPCVQNRAQAVILWLKITPLRFALSLINRWLNSIRCKFPTSLNWRTAQTVIKNDWHAYAVAFGSLLNFRRPWPLWILVPSQQPSATSTTNGWDYSRGSPYVILSEKVSLRAVVL